AASHPRPHPGLEGRGPGMGDAVLVEQEHRGGGEVEGGGVLVASLMAVQRGQQRPVRDGHGDGAGRPGGSGGGGGRGGSAHQPALCALGSSCNRSPTAAGRAVPSARAGTAAIIPSTRGSSTSAVRCPAMPRPSAVISRRRRRS